MLLIDIIQTEGSFVNGKYGIFALKGLNLNNRGQRPRMVEANVFTRRESFGR
jgi:hypothetical protein